jgi:hypothetical protein
LKNLISFANFRLLQETSADGFENIETFKFTSVSYIVDRNGGVKVDAKSFSPLSVFFEKFNNWCPPSVVKLALIALVNSLCVDVK